ncbi:thiosulfate oxidation carrier protein SoxY [uncultured Roseobacter sp.]|uniref:thiosulfate oxidation carrier protein SoxY n=1 Tax=uncultured Roseobacter sp. TaxID=114847 RepID=UPI002617EEE2|nr:thiosulfate oxidation carrier protein SoxY [uncultured Roseobacter sp.]
MEVTRRGTLMSGASLLLALGLPGALRAQDVTAEQAVAAFAGGAPLVPGGVSLRLDPVAEDGFKVPVVVAAEGAEALMIVAPRNPVPVIALARFGPLAVAPMLSTRMRLARTQEVMALARMADGTVRQVAQRVEVIVGGCGA